MATPNFILSPGTTLPECLTPASPPPTLTNIESFLFSQGRCVHNVLPDGNCMFRALSHQLYGNDKHNIEVRKLLKETIVSNHACHLPTLLDSRYALGKGYLHWTSGKTWYCGKLGHSSRASGSQWLLECNSVCLLCKSIRNNKMGKKGEANQLWLYIHPSLCSSGYFPIHPKTCRAHAVTASTTTKVLYLSRAGAAPAHYHLQSLFQDVVIWSSCSVHS